MPTATAPTYASTEKRGKGSCGYCHHREVAKHQARNGKLARQCAIFDDLAPATRPACCHYVISVERAETMAAWYRGRKDISEPATAVSAPTCRYCARREFVRKSHGNNRVYRCVLSDDIIATTDPACQDFDRQDEYASRRALRGPRNIVRTAPVAKPPAVAVATVKAGDKCPRLGCKRTLVNDYGNAYCWDHGTITDAEPRMPSPFGQIWPPRGQMAEW